MNTEGWYHTNQDPRQYIDYTLTNNTVFNSAGTAMSAQYLTSAAVVGKRVQVIDGGTVVLNGNTVALPDTIIETFPIDVNLDGAIAREESRIVAQGRITITAQYLNINGLNQSGTDHIQVDIASTFAPPARTTALADEFNHPLAGVTFGADKIPVDGYWDAANHRIVIEEIVPQGGEIILAGQIISTGNGLLRVANGYTNVSINNQSAYDLHIERIDVTTNKKGRIQITETSTGTGTAADPFERVEYTYSAGQVVEQHYLGVTDTDGFVNYTASGGATNHDPASLIQYQPVPGTQYFWVEGQEKTSTEVKYYKKQVFNLTGGLIGWLDDDLAGDESYQWKSVEFTDEKPLLESEGIILTTPGSTADDVAYRVEYKSVVLSAGVPDVDNWTTGGGWLRKKTYHKLVTTVSGLKDFYTHKLEADVPIRIDFIQGDDTPTVNITSGGSISFGEINVPDTVASSVNIKTTRAGANILQSTSSGIFGTNDVEINSAGSLRANIEGVKEPAGFAAFSLAPTVVGEVGAYKAAGDIWIGFFETEAGQVGTLGSERKVIVDYIWSTDGNVFVSAPDGIFAKDANSFIIGNQIELYAKEGQIGTAENPIFIDSDVHGSVGDGGVLAWAQGDIFIREMEGDLYLAKQLSLAAGFGEGDADAGKDNLKSTYGEIRPTEDGDAHKFAGSIHSTQGAVHIEVVAGSVYDAIEEGFVALTPEQIEARNARLGLTGEAGEAAALADLDADATAKTEAYHRYWTENRHAMRGAVTSELFVSSVDFAANVLSFASSHGLNTGDQVFVGDEVELTNTGLRTGAYFAIFVDGTHIKLAATRADASINPKPIDLVDNGAPMAGLSLTTYDYTEIAFCARPRVDPVHIHEQPVPSR